MAEEVTYDKTLVLAGPRPKRVRFRVVNTSLEQTTWNAKGEDKTTTKQCGNQETARKLFDKTVRKKLRDDYAVVSESREPGTIILEAFAPGGGGGAVLDLSPDGRFIVTATITSESMFGAKVEVVEVASGARHVVFDAPAGVRQNFIHTALFSRDARAVYFQRDSELLRVDIASGMLTEIAHAEGFNMHVVDPCFDRERRRLAVCDRESTVRVLDGDEHRSILEVPVHRTRECRGLAISQSGRLLALYVQPRGSGIDERGEKMSPEIHLWDIEAAAYWETVVVPNEVDRVGFTPADDALVVTWHYASGPAVLEIPSGRQLWRHPDQRHRALGWAYSPDGNQLATAGDGLELLDARTYASVIELPMVWGASSRPVFSNDGRLLAASIGGTAIVYAI